MQHFRQHAAEPHHDIGAEMRIVHRADDHFHPAGHFLHGYAIDVCLGRMLFPACGDGLYCGFKFVQRFHTEAHSVGFGFVRDVGGG